MKYAFVATCNSRYLYALNATMHAQNVAGTQANFEIVHGPVEPDYMEGSKTAFNFDVNWTPRETYPGDYFSYKYHHALAIADKYDAICIIDADEFLYTNLNEYFEIAAKENKLITANNTRYGPVKFKWGDISSVGWGKPDWHFADFPTFFNPKTNRKFLEDWIYYHRNASHPGARKESLHPCGGMNVSICKNLNPADIITLDGWQWVADNNISKFGIVNRDNKLFWLSGSKEHNLGDKPPYKDSQIFGVHNRWWQPGRANGEWRSRTGQTAPEVLKGLQFFEDTMNAVKSLMDHYCTMGLYDTFTFKIDGPVRRPRWEEGEGV
jgi:hypothetical protein